MKESIPQRIFTQARTVCNIKVHKSTKYLNVAFLLFKPHQCVIQQSGKPCAGTSHGSVGLEPTIFLVVLTKIQLLRRLEKETVWDILCHTATMNSLHWRSGQLPPSPMVSSHHTRAGAVQSLYKANEYDKVWLEEYWPVKAKVRHQYIGPEKTT